MLFKRFSDASKRIVEKAAMGGFLAKPISNKAGLLDERRPISSLFANQIERGPSVSMILQSATVPWLHEPTTRFNSERSDFRSRTFWLISVR
jgi:hypothetical protein